MQTNLFTQIRRVNVGSNAALATLIVTAFFLTGFGPSPVGAQVGPEDPVADVEAWVCQDVLNASLGTECVNDRRIAWEVLEEGSANQDDGFGGMVLSPDGSIVYRAGHLKDIDDEGAFRDLTIKALNASTGEVTWQYSHGRPAPGDPGYTPQAIGLSPDGARLVVASTAEGGLFLVSLDADTGAEQWQVREFFPVYGLSLGPVHFVSNDEFVVTGSLAVDTAMDRRVFAERRLATSGDVNWEVIYAQDDAAMYSSFSTVTADGSMLIVLAHPYCGCGSSSWITLAWNIGGGLAWNEPGLSSASSLALSGDKAFVTGGGDLAAVVARDLVTGGTLWTFETEFEGDAVDAVLSADGSTLFVAGTTSGEFPSDEGFFMTALDPATGTEQWTTRTSAGGSREGGIRPTILLNEVKGQVSFTGVSSQEDQYPWNWDIATLAWNATTGDHLWTERYNGPGDGSDAAHTVGLSPDGSRIFIGGYATGESGTKDIAVIAYGFDMPWEIADLLPEL